MKNKDLTLTKNYLKIIKNVILDYELTKKGKHPGFKFASDVFKHHKIPKQNFFKIYNRWKDNKDDKSLLPQKRGRKFGVLKTIPMIINKVIELRKQGFGRYEIYDLLLPKYGRYTPKPSTIYNILKKHHLNRFFNLVKRNKRKIVKEKLGELGHTDCHQIKKGTIENINKPIYLLAIIDDYSRICALETIFDLKSFTVSLSTIKLLSLIWQNYSFKFQKIISDNGSEFKGDYDKLLTTLGIQHKKTKPYHPQTNGKIERFWKTIEEELLQDKIYKDITQFQEDIFNYMIYYNHLRHHQAIDKKPVDLLEKVSTK